MKMRFTFVVFLSIASNCFAAWLGPIEVAKGGWGQEEVDFGIRYQDTYDSFPQRIYINKDGKVVVGDINNGRRKIYFEGVLQKITKCVQTPEGNWNEECNISGDYLLTNKEGNVWTIKKGKYCLTTPTGELLATYDEKPLELGVKSKRRNPADDTWTTTIQYEDATYAVTTPGSFDDPVRDLNGFLYGTASPQGVNFPWHYRVYKFDRCGKLIGTLDFPENIFVDHEEVIGEGAYGWTEVVEEYGPPVIGPDGSVYAWKRTPETYSILKWQWVDDPADPQPGPDAPENLKVIPSLDGLYLTWSASPQDPGCVDRYEIERSASADGIYTSAASVDKGTFKFNDTTALPGSTYFYKVRAVADGLSSKYTAPVSGTRE